MCVYLFKCIYIYIGVCTCVYIYIHMHIYIYMCVWIHMHTYFRKIPTLDEAQFGHQQFHSKSQFVALEAARNPAGQGAQGCRAPARRAPVLPLPRGTSQLLPHPCRLKATGRCKPRHLVIGIGWKVWNKCSTKSPGNCPNKTSKPTMFAIFPQSKPTKIQRQAMGPCFPWPMWLEINQGPISRQSSLSLGISSPWNFQPKETAQLCGHATKIQARRLERVESRNQAWAPKHVPSMMSFKWGNISQINK